MFDFTALDALDFDTLTAVKEKVAALIKARKDADKTAKVEAKAKAAEDKADEVRALIDAKTLAEGKAIVFMFKGAERTATVEKLTDKTFTVELTEGKRYIKFAAFLRMA